MNEALFNSIAFDISKRANEKQMRQLIQATLNKDVNALISVAKNTNIPITLDEYVNLIIKDSMNRVEQNQFIAGYLKMKGIACTTNEVNNYNENIRVALMREASFMCDEIIANDDFLE